MSRLATRRGYANFGRRRNFTKLRFIVLTDRDDGKLWGLIHDETFEYCGIDDTVPVAGDTDTYVYPAYDGPSPPGAEGARLFVRGGRLGYEAVSTTDAEADRDQHRVITRRQLQRQGMEIDIVNEANWAMGDTLAYRKRNLTTDTLI